LTPLLAPPTAAALCRREPQPRLAVGKRWQGLAPHYYLSPLPSAAAAATAAEN